MLTDEWPRLYARVTEPFLGVNLGGDWCMLNEVTGPAGNPNIGNTNGFAVALDRTDVGTYDGSGHKVSYKGRPVPRSSTLEFDPIVLNGDRGTRFDFVEDMNVNGKIYKGFFRLKYEDAGLVGTYHLSEQSLFGTTRMTRSTDPECTQLLAAPDPPPA